MNRKLKNRFCARHYPLLFNDPVFGASYMVLFNVGNDPQTGANVLNYIQDEFQLEIPKDDGGKYLIGDKIGCCTARHSCEIVIQFAKCKLTNSTLVHECVHAALHVFDKKGLPVDTYHDEPLAYYIGWLVNNITCHGNKHDLWQRGAECSAK